jgi:hypothetical protein
MYFSKRNITGLGEKRYLRPQQRPIPASQSLIRSAEIVRRAGPPSFGVSPRDNHYVFFANLARP